MDPFNFILQPMQRPAGQPPSTPPSNAQYVIAQPGMILQQRVADDPFLDLGDLDEIIGGGLCISPDATFLAPPQTTLPALHQPPPLAPPPVLPPSSPVPAAAKRSIPSKLQVAGVVDLGLDPKTHEHCFRLPLPNDVDEAFDKLQITVGGKRGFQLDSCVGLKYKDHPNPTILKRVDDAGMVLDQFIPGPDVVVQRGALPDETLSAHSQAAATKKEPPYGFTLAHLLTIICRKQYNARNHIATNDPEKLKAYPRYEWLWVISVARSDGKEGPVRWFPELEVRIPPEWWDTPLSAAGRTLSLPCTPRPSPRLSHTPRSPPHSPTAYSPYPSPRQTQSQRSYSDRLHKRTGSAVASAPRPPFPKPGPSIAMNMLEPQFLTSGPILLPLPEGVNPRVRHPIFVMDDPVQRGVCLHNIYTTARADRLLEYLRETIMDADKPLVHGPEVNCTIVERGFFPGERRGRAGRPIKERNDTGRWTLADILTRIIIKQREWYRKDLRDAEVQHLIASSTSPAWHWWTQRGMHEDLVWIVAIRQTLPDHQGLTRWIPEIELRDR